MPALHSTKQRGGGMFSSTKPDQQKRIAAANAYLGVFNGGRVSVPGALKWFELNIWKPYVYKSNTIYTLGYGAGYTSLYPEEFRLLHEILRKFNETLVPIEDMQEILSGKRSKTDERRKIAENRAKLYSDIIGVDEDAAKSIDHTIRYISECLEKYVNYDGCLQRILLDRGALVKKGSYTTASVPRSTPLPTDKGNLEGWKMIFALLSMVGGEIFTPEEDLGNEHHLPAMLTLDKISIACDRGRYSGGSKTKSASKTRRRSKK
jgi:hypothetical protein